MPRTCQTSNNVAGLITAKASPSPYRQPLQYASLLHLFVKIYFLPTISESLLTNLLPLISLAIYNRSQNIVYKSYQLSKGRQLDFIFFGTKID